MEVKRGEEYREIPEDRILSFPATPGFKGWKHFFTDESITHPAKMNLNLLRSKQRGLEHDVE